MISWEPCPGIISFILPMVLLRLREAKGLVKVIQPIKDGVKIPAQRPKEGGGKWAGDSRRCGHWGAGRLFPTPHLSPQGPFLLLSPSQGHHCLHSGAHIPPSCQGKESVRGPLCLILASVPRHRKGETCQAAEPEPSAWVPVSFPPGRNSQHDPISQLAAFHGKWEQTTGNQELSRPIRDTQHNPTAHFLPSFSALGTQCFASPGSGDAGQCSTQPPNSHIGYGGPRAG